mgnify:CR=1 FL=1
MIFCFMSPVSSLFLCQSVFLSVQATVDGKTDKVTDALVQQVCEYLRGVRSLDNRNSPMPPFSASQIDALNFLRTYYAGFDWSLLVGILTCLYD